MDQPRGFGAMRQAAPDHEKIRFSVASRVRIFSWPCAVDQRRGFSGRCDKLRRTMERCASQLLLVSVSFHGPALWISEGVLGDATRRAAAARRRSPPPPPEVCSMAAVAAATAHHAVIFITLKYFFYYIIKIVCFGVLHCNAPQWWPRRRPTPYSLSYLLYYNFYYIIKTVVAATAAYMLLFTTASTSLQFGAAKRTQ